MSVDDEIVVLVWSAPFEDAPDGAEQVVVFAEINDPDYDDRVIHRDMAIVPTSSFTCRRQLLQLPEILDLVERTEMFAVAKFVARRPDDDYEYDN
jgi:hypothetical protein